MINYQEVNSICNQIDVDYKVYKIKEEELTSLISKKQELITLGDDLVLLSSFLNKLVDSRRDDIIEKITSLISFGLNSILDRQGMELKLDSRLQRGRQFYQFRLIDNGMEIDPLKSCGGGVINILSILLRIVILSMSSNRKFLVIDEGFANLSANHREKAVDFLKLAAQKLGVQFLIVTHQEELKEAADMLYEIKERDGYSIFKKIS